MTNIDFLSAPTVAFGPATSAATLAGYSTSGYAGIRYRVTQHSNTPTSVLQGMLGDSNSAVRSGALRVIMRRYKATHALTS